ncbi:HET-domain-containing protein [Zopfia rhizophila CBS 207.26]|uniref:HET-domain-containing protein n=1 Tax=Zopfia rhizophila CBS 207.26 TaxID=1314779 RepID=A0A6A6DBP1_9PEZI|nr:HET-domain-containing protein [Zopfia rhizophila CBS 207.26]
MAAKDPANREVEIFQHQPLDHAKSSLRLLMVLREKSPEGYVQCTLFHASTEEMTEAYTCLSYVWGTRPDHPNPYFITMNGKRMEVLRNLHEFLQVAREKYLGELLWIDALCIDQSNVAERNHQVAEMGRIYSRAKQVIAWLGPCDSTVNPLTYLRPKSFDSWPTQDKLEDCRRLFNAADSYWSRAWITQEMALAHRVLLLFGAVELDLHSREGRSFVVALMNMTGDSRRKGSIFEVCMLATDTRWLAPLSTEDAHILGVTPLLETPRDFLRILGLLSKFRTKKCFRGRDKIYSLRSLCAEGRSIQVNYDMSPPTLLQHVIRISQRPLCFCSAITLIGASEIREQDPIQLEMMLHCAGNMHPNRTMITPERCSMCGFNSGILTDRFFCFSEVCTGYMGHLRLSSDQNICSVEYTSPSSFGRTIESPDGAVESVQHINRSLR